ncbi:hypothetical protein MASR1M65_22880 [Saprospiraceae bacterium]
MSESHDSLSPELVSIMFDPRKDALLCNNDPAADQIRTSAVNFYNHEGFTEADVSSNNPEIMNTKIKMVN